MDLERELRQALRRRPAPDGFTDRVMAKLETRDRRPRRFMPRWVPAAVAAMLLAGAFSGTAWYRERRERARAEEAAGQLLVALRITGSQLDQVRQKVRSISHQEN